MAARRSRERKSGRAAAPGGQVGPAIDPAIERAFTLLELLAALVILAVSFAIVLPALTAGGGVEAASAARTIAAGLRQTRDRAISLGAPQALWLDVEQGRFALAGEER